VETARAFADEVRTDTAALETGRFEVGQSVKVVGPKEDLDAINRQRKYSPTRSCVIFKMLTNHEGIRKAILDGDVDKALKYTNAYYPTVLQDNEHIYFRLRCRKFIEMIRQCADLYAASESAASRNSHNGHHDLYEDDVFDNDMELDEPSSTSEWDKMETEEADIQSKYQSLLGATLQYGQELHSAFRENSSREVKKGLEETFSLMAYTNPRESINAHLLNPKEREPVAEELNSAILGSSP